MTTGSPLTSATSSSNGASRSRQQQQLQHHALPNHSSATFQQIKQTQASLARLYRVHQLNQSQQQTNNQLNNQSSQLNQQQQAKSIESPSQQQSQSQRSTTFVDCLIRRFKNCFSEDFCTVPMFVVGNLSPGSDGTHLILPPCVSLGRQNINRFSSPKNLRLMNSIRESCRSIEELDLGGNKLTDLIEVYKILQCTPNLRFLNLSENDLSRTSPVAMASSSSSSSGHSTTISQSSTMISSLATSSSLVVPVTQLANHHQQHHPLQTNLNQTRTCLAPINQNQLHHPLGARRHHSTLGTPIGGASTLAVTQSSPSATTTSNPVATGSGGAGGGANSNSSRSVAAIASSTTPNISPSQPSTSSMASTSRIRPAASRVAEARRLAAANALAQSKKTSSLVASKLADSAAAGEALTRHHQRANLGSSRGRLSNSQASGGCEGAASLNMPPPMADKRGPLVNGRLSATTAHQRHQSGPTSTMCLARSLSSLSAKDVRAATSSPMNRFTSHRSSVRKESNASFQRDRRSSMGILKSAGISASIANAAPSVIQPSSANEQHLVEDSTPNQAIDSSARRLTTSLSHQKLYVEPIVETDDVDMAEQLSPNTQQEFSGTQQATTSNSQTISATIPATKSLVANQAGSNSMVISNNVTRSSLSNTGNSQHCSMSIANNNNLSASNITFRRTFESIKALALNNTGCQWRVVCSILSRMPNLEELHLSLNNYERIDLDPSEFKHHSLKRLYLCNNPKLTNWEELDKLLIAFPSLEALSIANCNISQIPDNLDRAREWRKLCGLNINGWPIKEWPVVERLNQLPSLIDLKCRNLEVLSTIDEPRHHLIARLPKLQRLNGSEIEEREDAEKAFLRFFMANSHLERPTRFHELIQIHGEVGPVGVDVDLSPPTHAQSREPNRDVLETRNHGNANVSHGSSSEATTTPKVDRNQLFYDLIIKLNLSNNQIHRLRMRLKPAAYNGQVSEYFQNEHWLRYNIDSQYYFCADSNKCRNSFSNNVILSEPGVGHEKVKQMEEIIMDLVYESTLATERNDNHLSLAKANEALKNFDSLRKMLIHEQRSGSSMARQSVSDEAQANREPLQPMLTTQVNLFDLNIMVKSNVATQFKNANHLEEALEIYMQLCKLVGSSSNGLSMGSLMSQAVPGGAGSSSQRNGSKFYLYRFGMNIGNIYAQLGDYQRALKYFRLTLDRLSSSGCQQLRLKLINNIATTLMLMNNDKPTSDVISSLGQLLADNLKQTKTPRPKSNSSIANQQQLINNVHQNPSSKLEFEAINSNHFRFILNMMVCLNMRGDLQNMVSILKTNINVRIGQQYAFLNLPSTTSASSKHTYESLGNKLLKLIRVKQVQVDRCLIMSCNLMLELAARKSQSHQKGTNLCLEFCLRLLASSELYKDLALELKTNSATSLLSRRGKLDEAVKLLEQVDIERQHLSLKFDPQQQESMSTASASGDRFKGAQMATVVGQSSANDSSMDEPLNASGQSLQAGTINCRSSNVLTNVSLLYLLRNHLRQGQVLAENALQVKDAPSACEWINLATCHYYLDHLEEAESCYKQALSVDNNCWLARYNLILLNRKLGRHYDELDHSIRDYYKQTNGPGSIKNVPSVIDDDNGREKMYLAKLMYNKLFLLPIQMGLLYQKSSMSKQAHSILRDLTKQKVQSPEIYLYLSKLMMENLKLEQANGVSCKAGNVADQFQNHKTNISINGTNLDRHFADQSNISLLKVAARNHSYHLPLAERLIALYINNFNYKPAQSVLMDCIKNRPDQVKWYQMLAECYRHAADYKQAMQVYKQAIDLFPLDTSCLKSMAKLTAELGLTEENKLCQTKLDRVFKRLGEA